MIKKNIMKRMYLLINLPLVRNQRCPFSLDTWSHMFQRIGVCTLVGPGRQSDPLIGEWYHQTDRTSQEQAGVGTSIWWPQWGVQSAASISLFGMLWSYLDQLISHPWTVFLWAQQSSLLYIRQIFAMKATNYR